MKKTHRTFVLGDLHGGYKALMQCLKRSKFDYENDTLISLGDVSDGWPEVVECFEELLKIKNFIMVMGNHDCYAKGTEILTENGWKDISKHEDNLKIAQFDLKSGEISFALPLGRVEKEVDSVVDISGISTRQVVSDNHDVVIGGKKIPASLLLKGIVKVEHKDFRYSGLFKDGGIAVDDDVLRLAVWTVMDGCIVNEKKTGKTRIQFHLSKERKIAKLIEILDRSGIKYTHRITEKTGINKLQPHMICIYKKESEGIRSLLEMKKVFPGSFRNIDHRQFNIILSEIENTDGTLVWESTRTITLSSTEKCNLDILQEMCIRNGYKCNISKKVGNASGFPNGKKQYLATIRENFGTGTKKEITVKRVKYSGKVYSYGMPKGTLITRYDGKVAFSGNSWLYEWMVDQDNKPNVWVKQGGAATLASYAKYPEEMRNKHYEFLKTISHYYVDGENRLFVHGGLEIGVPIEKQHPTDIMWNRELVRPDANVPEYKEVYIGHTSVWRISDKPVQYGNVICVDSGGGWEGKLSLINIDTKKVFQSDMVEDLYPEIKHIRY